MFYQLPNLDYEPPRTLNAERRCTGEDCVDCTWFVGNDAYCSGCDSDYQKRCVNGICVFTSCRICGGGKGKSVPSCCGRAPNLWKEEWEKLYFFMIPNYSPGPIDIKCRLIPMIHSIKKYEGIPDAFPEIDAWLVPIHKIADVNGRFRSADIKDYLGLSPDKKLILSTSSPDDYQEMLWRRRGDLDFRRYGIDYWFPAHFSIYDNDSKMAQFGNAKRQQIHAILSRSQFFWFRLGEHIPIEYLAPIRQASSVLISANKMVFKANKKIFQNEVQKADRWFPKSSAFFILGNPRNLNLTSGRTCYEINSTWLIRGLRGYGLDRNLLNIPKREVLIHNLREALKNV
jgi:hypothetical protein